MAVGFLRIPPIRRDCCLDGGAISVGVPAVILRPVHSISKRTIDYFGFVAHRRHALIQGWLLSVAADQLVEVVGVCGFAVGKPARHCANRMIQVVSANFPWVNVLIRFSGCWVTLGCRFMANSGYVILLRLWSFLTKLIPKSTRFGSRNSWMPKELWVTIWREKSWRSGSMNQQISF